MNGNLAWRECNKSHSNIAATRSRVRLPMALAIFELDTCCTIVARAIIATIVNQYTCDDGAKRRNAESSNARRLGVKRKRPIG